MDFFSIKSSAESRDDKLRIRVGRVEKIGGGGQGVMNAFQKQREGGGYKKVWETVNGKDRGKVRLELFF